MKYADVEQVCDQLFANGYSARQISFSAVRGVLGRGDKGDVLKHIKQWKLDHEAELTERDDPQAIPVPADLTTAISRALGAAAVTATKQLRAELQQASDEADKRDAELTAALEQVSQLQVGLHTEKDAHAQTRGRAEQLSMDLTAVRASLEAETARRQELEAGAVMAAEAVRVSECLKNTIAQLKGQLEAAQQHTDQMQAQLDQLRQREASFKEALRTRDDAVAKLELAQTEQGRLQEQLTRAGLELEEAKAQTGRETQRLSDLLSRAQTDLGAARSTQQAALEDLRRELGVQHKEELQALRAQHKEELAEERQRLEAAHAARAKAEGRIEQLQEQLQGNR